MADLFPVAGAKIYIGPAKATSKTDFVAADFSSLTGFVEIDGWQTMGSYGDTASEITSSLINRGRDVKIKGTRNAGNMENVFAQLLDDPGQIALRGAEKTNDNYAFKIVWPDGTSAATGTTIYFVAMVMSSNVGGGDANTVVVLNATISINSNIVEVAAS